MSGSTLASGVTASSITSLGTLTGLTVDGNAGVTGNLTVSGTTQLNGHVDIGNATNDTVSITAAVNSNLNPDSTSNNRDLGNFVQKWRNVYAVNLYGNGANVSSLNASNLSSGTVPAARLPNHSASLLTSGTIPDARISGNFLRSDQSDTFTGDLTVNGVIYLQDQIRIGDDVLLEDCNVANTFRVKGNSSHVDGDVNKGFIAFGSQQKIRL